MTKTTRLPTRLGPHANLRVPADAFLISFMQLVSRARSIFFCSFASYICIIHFPMYIQRLDRKCLTIVFETIVVLNVKRCNRISMYTRRTNFDWLYTQGESRASAEIHLLRIGRTYILTRIINITARRVTQTL